MILCITPNPAIDRTMRVAQLQLGEVHRVSESIVAAGGKGLNVARVARTLGAAVRCAGFAGGHSGRLLAELAEREGLPGEWTWIAGETRTCVIVVAGRQHDATVINEQGPPVSVGDWLRLTEQAARAAAGAQAICLSGSLPPGSLPAHYAELLRRLRATGRPLWADTSGPALAAALEVGGVGVKVNGSEAGALLGVPIAEPQAALAAARVLHGRTRAPVVLTLGGAGAVLANDQGGWHVQPPPIRLVSTVGSGDAFLAGWVVALTRGAAPPAALRQAAAAGAANAMAFGGGQIERAALPDLIERTKVTAYG